MSLLRKLRRQADDKNGNAMTLETLERRVLLNADLAIDAFDIDSPAAPPVLWGDSLTLATDIANIGDVDAGAFDSKIFLSEDNVLDGSDIELDSFSIGGLTVSEISMNDRVMSLPGTGTDGDYHLILQTDTGDAVLEDDENNNISVMPLFIGDSPPPPPGEPDLFASNVQVPSNALPGDTFNVDYEIHNPTNENAGAFDVSVVLSQDAILDGADLVLATHTVAGGLGPNSMDTPQSSVTIPDDGSVGPGPYHIGVIVDPTNQVQETDENNNTDAVPIQIDDPGPPPPPPGIDLVFDIDGFGIDSPDPLHWGDTITVAADVKNVGDTPSGNFDVQFYLSQDPVLDGGDTLLHTLPLNSLAAAELSTNNVQVPLPAPGTLTDGDYHIIGVIDGADAVSETDENNNIAMEPTAITEDSPPPPPSGIDLTFDVDGFGIDSPAPFHWGDTLTVGADVKNIGDTPSGNFDVQFFLSQDPVLDGGDALLHTLPLNSLGAAEVSVNNVQVPLPAPGAHADGDYHIIWAIDNADVVTETDENNNIAMEPIAITEDSPPPPGGIDLTFDIDGAGIDSSGPFHWDDTITVAADVKNLGDTASGSFDVEFYLSQDNIKDGGDTLLHTLPLSSLAQNEVSTNNVQLTLPGPGTLADGDYHIIWSIDGANVVSETDENNNTAIEPLSITEDGGPPPLVEGIDLAGDLLMDPGANPQPIEWGDTISVDAAVFNMGTVDAATAFDVKVVLSSDNQVDAGDTELTSFQIPSLASATESEHPLNLTLPATGTDGAYELLLVIDTNDTVAEADEANNVFNLPLAISTDGGGGGDQPDLEAHGPDIVAPGGLVWGGTYEAIADVVNVSNTAAGSFTALVVFSTDAVFDPADEVLMTLNSPGLGVDPNHEFINDIDITLPAPGTHPDGSYSILVVADSDNTVVESDENNNLAIQTVEISSTPNLIPGIELEAFEFDVDSDPFDGQMAWGESYLLAADAFNKGDTDAGAFTISIALSADATFDAGDTLLSEVAVAALLSNTGSINDVNITLPVAGTLPDGPYHLVMAVDSGDTVAEADENNNELSIPVQVSDGGDPPPPPTGIDLLFDFDGVGIDAPGPFNWGDSVTVAADVKNVGDTPSGNFDVQFFLSQDNVKDAADTLLHTLPLNSLGSNEVSGNDVLVTLPAPGTLADGPYHIIVAIDDVNVVTETDEINNVEFIPLQIGDGGDPPPLVEGIDLGGDLIVDFSPEPQPILWGDTIDVEAKVFNMGMDDATGPFDVKVLLSSDPLADAADVELTSFQIPSLASATESVHPLSLLLPASGTDGPYELILVVDSADAVTEADELNNIFHMPIQIGDDGGDPPPVTGIDLTFDIDGVGVDSPAPFNWGDPLLVRADVKNLGDTPSGNFDVQVFLSQDPILDATDTLLHTLPLNSLGANEISTNDLQIALPAPGTLTDGPYHLVLSIDGANVVVEEDENNNVGMIPLQIGDGGDPPPPVEGVDLAGDLFVELGPNPQPILWGDTINVDANIFNMGDQDATGPFDVKVLLSGDGIVDATDIELTSFQIPSLASLAESNHPLSLPLPATGVDGPHELILVIDSTNVVVEADEANNTFNMPLFIGDDGGDPPPTDGIDLAGDLFADFGPNPQPLLWGDTLNVDANIFNFGTLDATGPFEVKVMLSDSAGGVADVELTSFQIPSLGAGSESNHPLSLALPATGTDGPYELKLVIDSTDAVVEADEENNSFHMPIFVGPDGGDPPPAPGIDLMPDDEPLVPPIDIVWGNTYELPIDIFNDGDTASGPFMVKVVFSQDTLIDATDTVLAEFEVPDIQPFGDSINDIQTTLPAPGTLPNGLYHIIIFADSGGVVVETNEDNNIVVHQLEVTDTPDLTPGIDLELFEFDVDLDSSGTGTALLTWGDSLPAFTGLVNKGDTDAGPFTLSIALSNDPFFDAGDTILTDVAITGLLSGELLEQDLFLTLPDAGALPDGEYHIIAKVDSTDAIAEVNEDNNQGDEIEFIGSGPGANGDVDLTISQIILPPPPLFWGGFFDLQTDIFNAAEGSLNGQNFNVTVYLSDDDLITPDDMIIGEDVFDHIGPLDTLNGFIPIQLPPPPFDGVIPNSMFIGVMVDSTDQVAELDEGNNINLVVVPLEMPELPTGVDLVVPFVHTQPQAGSGDEIIIEYGLDNFGDSDAGAFDVQFFLSTDPFVDVDEFGNPLPHEILLGVQDFAGLAATTFTDNTMTLTLPGELDNGFYHLIAVANLDGSVEEADTFNNFGIGFVDLLGGGADLVIHEMFLPFDAQWGQTIFVDADVANFGGQRVENIDVSFYLSDDFQFDATDTLLSTTILPFLDGGQFSLAHAEFALPDGEGEGLVNIIAVVDPGNAIEETDEQNNEFARDVFIGDPERPNLLAWPVPLFSPGQDSIDWGQVLNVETIINNFSNAFASAFDVTYYLSSDDLLSGDDTLVHTEPVAGIGPFENLLKQVAITLPASSPGGDQQEWFLMAKADGNDAIVEFDEFDNVGWSPIFVGSKPADLGGWMETLTDPNTPVLWGDSVSLAGQIDNFGGSDAGSFVVNYYLSTDPEIDATDTLLDSQTINALGAGQTAPVVSSLTLPADPGDLGTGTFFIIAQIDAGDTVVEVDEFNNFMGDWLTTDAPVAELVGFNVDAGFNAFWGSPITAHYGLGNFGLEAASNFDVSFFLADPGGNLDNAFLLGSVTIDQLGSDQELFDMIQLQMPNPADVPFVQPSQENATYSLIMKVDSGETVDELFEDNNTFFMPIRMEALTGFMEITDSSFDPHDRFIDMGVALLGQDPIVHTFTINNHGAGPLNVFDVFSTHPDIEVVVGPGQAAGGVGPFVVNVDGSLTFEVVLTPTFQGFIQDTITVLSDDPDQSDAFIQVMGDVATAPVDLSISSIGADNSAQWGDLLDVSVQVKNLQNGAADGAFLDVVLSDSPDPFGQFFHLFSMPIDQVIAGDSTLTQDLQIQLPDFSPFGFGGDLFLRAMIHPDGAFDENFENNEFNRPIEITSEILGKPDLTFAALFLPQDVAPGEPFESLVGLFNAGLGDAEGFQVNTYFSSDDILDDDDLLLTATDVPGLSALTGREDFNVLTIPDTVDAVGVNFILVQIDPTNDVSEDFEDNNLAVVRFNLGETATTDLVAESLAAPTEAVIGEEFAVDLTVANTGVTDAPGVRVEFFLSESPEDTGFFGAYLGSTFVDVPAGGSVSANFNAFLPNGIAQAGQDYFVRALVDVDDIYFETSESNNMLVSDVPLAATAGDVDLTAQIDQAPAQATWGQLIPLSATVSNTGTIDAAPFFVDVFLSADGTLDPTDFYLSSQIVFGLAPGQQTLDFETMLPHFLPTGDGDYQLIVNVDGGQSVFESNEDNNAATSSLTITGTPDLDLILTSAPFTGSFDQTIVVGDSVANIGLSDAGAFDINYYLSEDPFLDAGDALLGSRAVTALASNSEDQAETELTLPAEGVEGFYHLIAVADQADSVAETHEEFLPDGEIQHNNIGIWGLNILDDSIADLRPTAVSTNETADWGDTLVVQNTVENSGTDAAENVTVTFFLSDNRSITSRDFVLGTRTLESIDADGENSQSTILTLPAENPFGEDGDFYIGMFVDSEGTVGESNEENNILVSDETIQIGNPITVDLLAAYVATPPIVRLGDTLEVYNEVYNAGTTDAANFTVDFYLTQNGVLDASAIQLGQRTVSSLAGGGFDGQVTALTLPASVNSLAGQSFTVAMVVNADESVVEKTHDNNTTESFNLLTVAEALQSDVEAASLSVDGNANWGDSITLDFQVNASVQSNDPVQVAFFLSQTGTLGSAIQIGETVTQGGSGSLDLILPDVSPFGRDGAFQVVMVVDPDNVIEESDEANNLRGAFITIGSGLADLVALDISGVDKVAAGESFQTYNAVSNFGSVDSGSFDVYFYLTDSNGSVDTSSDILLGNRSVGNIVGGDFNWTISTLTIPANVVDGDYYLAMVADRFDDVDETSEANNIGFSGEPVKVRTITVAPDDNEPNNTSGSATAVTFDADGQSGTMNATLHTSSDLDYYQFTTPNDANGFARISVVPDETLNAAILVYDSAGVLIGGADADPTFGGDETFTTFNFAPARTYTVLVKPIGNSLGTYTMDMELGAGQVGDAYEENDTQTSAHYLGTANNHLDDPSIHVGDDVDYYQFGIPATSTGAVAFSIDPDPSLDGILQIFDADGILIGSSDIGGADASESVDFEGVIGANYFAKVTAWAESTGGYDLDLSFIPAEVPDGYEPNDDSATAHELTSSNLPDPTIHGGDVDFYRLTLPEGMTSFEAKVFGSAGLDATVNMHDADGNLVHTVNRGGVDEFETLWADGFVSGQVLYLSIEGANDTTGKYSLEVNFNDTATGDFAEPNNSIDTALQLELIPDRVTLTDLSIHDADDRDTYSFVAPADANGNATISLLPHDATGELNVAIRLLDSTGAVITSTDATGAGVAEQLSVAGQITAGDTYYIDINGWGTAGSYDLTVVTPLASVAEAQGLQPDSGDTPLPSSFGTQSSGVLADGEPPEIAVIEEIAGVNDDDLSFGTTPSGTSLTFNINILNTGGSDLNISDITLGGADSGVFSILWADDDSDASGVSTLAAGSSRELAVTFAPTAVQLYSDATLTINNNDADEAAYVLALSGTGSVSSQKPDINVVDLNSDDLTTLTFDNTGVDAETTDSFLITNTGAASLTVTAATISGANADSFELVTTNLANKTSDDYIIASDGQRAIQVRFSPTADGDHNAILTLTSNDPDETTVVINLTGTAVEPNLVVDLTPTDGTVANALDPSLDFGSQVNDGAGGQAGQFPINIVNTGTSDLTISSITFGVDSPFTITGLATDGATVAPGETIMAWVNFDPSFNGTFNDTMTVNSDDLDAPVMQFNLTGDAIEAFTQVLTGSETFSFTDTDGDVIQIQTVKGGTATLTFDGATADGSNVDDITLVDANKNGQILITILDAAGNGAADINTINVVDTGFGTIRVTGDVGTIDVDGPLKLVDVSGTLGGLDADGAVKTINLGGLTDHIDVWAIKALTVNGDIDYATITTDLTSKSPAISAMTVTGDIMDTIVNTVALKKFSAVGDIDELTINTSGAKAQVGSVLVTGDATGLDINSASLKAVTVDGNLHDSAFTATTGKGSIGKTAVSGDADVDITASGAIKDILVGGSLSGDIAANGAKGQIGKVNAGGDFTANLSALKAIKEVRVAGAIDSDSITVLGTGKGKIGSVVSGGTMDVANLDIDGAIKDLTAGSTGTAGDLLGTISSNSTIKKVTVFGNIGADITADGKLGTIQATGDLLADASITSTSSDIDNILIGDEIFGNITAKGGLGRIKKIQRSQNTFVDAETDLVNAATDHITADLSKTKWLLD